MIGVIAAGVTFFASLLPGLWGAVLLMVALVLWLTFIVQILRAVRPE